MSEILNQPEQLKNFVGWALIGIGLFLAGTGGLEFSSANTNKPVGIKNRIRVRKRKKFDPIRMTVGMTCTISGSYILNH